MATLGAAAGAGDGGAAAHRGRRWRRFSSKRRQQPTGRAGAPAARSRRRRMASASSSSGSLRLRRCGGSCLGRTAAGGPGMHAPDVPATTFRWCRESGSRMAEGGSEEDAVLPEQKRALS